MSNKFNNYIAELQSELVIWPAYYIEQEKNYGQSLPQSKGAKILEFGPGRGYFTDWLLCMGYENITLVEYDQNNCDFLAKKYQKISSVKVVYCDMVSYLKECNDMFDLIISKQVIEHVLVEDIPSVFLEGQRILNKGGLMLHETINASNVIFGTYYRYIDFSHTISFTEKSLSEFSEQKSVARNFYHPSIFLLIYSKVSKKEIKIIDKLKSRLSLPEEKTLSETGQKSARKINIFSTFFSHLISNFRWTVSVIITKFFFGSRIDVKTPFIIVEIKN